MYILLYKYCIDAAAYHRCNDTYNIQKAITYSSF